jgi:hypothetical protein
VSLEERLAVIISGKDDGASSAFSKVGSAADDAAKKTAASAEAVAVAQSKSKLAGIGAQRAAVDLAVAQRNLAAVTAKSTSTDEQKKRATLAVQTAEVKHADAARAAGKAEAEASRAAKLHATTLDEVKTGANRAGGALKTALAAGAAGAAVAIVAFGKKAVNAASDLAESTSKARVVFGDSSDAVLKFGDSAAKGLGQSKQQAIEAAGSFGALFVAMGIGQKPAADLSISIVKLASDLASFNNSSPEEALTALRSGLIGETEPLRAFGVNLSAAAVQNEAVRLGLAKTPASASAAAKAQAAYSLILQQTKTAQGDFARTAGGAANQQRIFAAQSADLAATAGKLLLPALIGLEKVAIGLAGPLGSLAGTIATMPTPAKDAAIGVISMAAAAKTLSTVVPKVAESVSTFLTAVKGIQPGTLVAGGALLALGGTLGLLVANYQSAEQKTRDFFDMLFEAAGAKDPAAKIKVLQAALDNFSKGGGEGARLTIHQAAEAKRAIKDLEGQVKSKADADKIAAAATEKSTTAVDLNSKSLANQGALAFATATHLNEFGEKVSDATGKVLDQKTAVDELTYSLDKLNGKSIAAAEGSIEFKNSLETLRTSVKDNGKSLDETSQKGRDNRTAFINAAKAASDFSTKVGDQKGYNAGRAALISSRAELERTGEKLGLSKRQVQALIDTFLRVPPVKRTEIELKIEAAKKKAAEIQRAIGQVRGKTVTVQVNQSGNLQKITRDLQTIKGYGTIPVSISVNGRVLAFSKGGEVKGGVPGQDSVPALLTPGEYVETVAERRANRLRLRGARQPGGGSGGGPVNVAAGAVQLTVQGSLDTAAMPAVQRMVDAAFADLARELQSGRRR